MKLKLDENLDVRLSAALTDAGHEAESVYEEGMSGASDDDIYQVCVREARTIVTLDLDFSNPFRFPPAPTEGTIVVRPPRPVLPMVRATLMSALPQLGSMQLSGKPCIVEPGRVRVYDPDETDA